MINRITRKSLSIQIHIRITLCEWCETLGCIGLSGSSDLCPVLPPKNILLNCILHVWFLALRLTRQEHSAPTLGDMIEKVLPGK